MPHIPVTLHEIDNTSKLAAGPFQIRMLLINIDHSHTCRKRQTPYLKPRQCSMATILASDMVTNSTSLCVKGPM